MLIVTLTVVMMEPTSIPNNSSMNLAIEHNASNFGPSLLSKPTVSTQHIFESIVPLEGSLKQIPNSIVNDIKDHLAPGCNEDFLIQIYPGATTYLNEQGGREAKFVSKKNNESVEVSRFSYARFANGEFQVVVAEFQTPNRPGRIEHAIIFPSGTNGTLRRPENGHRGLQRQNCRVRCTLLVCLATYQHLTQKLATTGKHNHARG